MASSSNPPLSITVYRGSESPGTYVWSPFVTKLEARLRFAGLPYRTESGSAPKGPRGKIPYVAISRTAPGGQASPSPTVLGDSSLISEKLVEDNLVRDLNARLTPTEKTQDLALRALLEDRLYFYQEYERWMQHYYTMRPYILWAVPYPVQIVVGLLVYRTMRQTLYGQGTMRFSAEELSSFRKQIWESLNALLVASRSKKQESGTDPAIFWVMGGNEPTEADTTLFGFICSALVCASKVSHRLEFNDRTNSVRRGPETRETVRGFPVMMDYARRIHDHYFPDYTLGE